MTGRASEGWNAVGFMQAPVSKSAGEGYGLYQFSGYANAGQGVGICFVMWRADNTWLDKSSPNAGTELDILESWNKTQSGTSTIHYYQSGSSSTNGESSHNIAVDLTKTHTYSMDWERGSLTYYVDGNEIYKDTTHAPLDAADGGSNEVMGAEVVNEASLVTTSKVQLHITDMSYSAPVSGGTDTVAPTTGTSPNPVFISSANATVALTKGETLTDNGSSNTLVLPAAGGVTLNANVLSNGDKLDLRAVMAATTWDGKTDDLGAYLTKSTSNDGKNLQVLLHSSGGSASVVLATVTSVGEQHGIFGSFKAHSLLH